MSDERNAGQLVAKSFNNRSDIEASSVCGCFYCFKIFPPTAITFWADSEHPDDEDPGALRSDEEGFPGTTAICPFCDYDSVIGNASCGPIDRQLLERLHDYWHK